MILSASSDRLREGEGHRRRDGRPSAEVLKLAESEDPCLVQGKVAGAKSGKRSKIRRQTGKGTGSEQGRKIRSCGPVDKGGRVGPVELTFLKLRIHRQAGFAMTSVEGYTGLGVLATSVPVRAHPWPLQH